MFGTMLLKRYYRWRMRLIVKFMKSIKFPIDNLSAQEWDNLQEEVSVLQKKYSYFTAKHEQLRRKSNVRS
jgi:hypothetical protein